jgi:flagellar basal body P-ring formation chaperone FlgA
MLNVFSKFKKTSGRSFFILSGICLAHTALAACYTTPLMAIAAASVTSSSSISEKRGYRVERIQSDPVLRQTWAMVLRCDHPEWPAVAVPLRDSSLPLRVRVQEGAKNIPQSVVIRAGEIVRVWRQETSLRIEVAGISEGNGGLGDLIKVRLMRRNTDDQSIDEQFSGIVRGPSDVEMKP